MYLKSRALEKKIKVMYNKQIKVQGEKSYY